MALTAVIDPTTTISADGSTLTGADATGNYNVSTNPGGYGAPNQERGAVWLVVAVFRMVSPDQLEGVPIADYDGLAATQFSASITEDGLYDWRLIPVNNGVPSGTFPVDTVYRDPGDGLIYQTVTADTVAGAVEILDTAPTEPYTSQQVEALLVALDNVADDRKVDFVPFRYQVRRARVVYLLNTRKCSPGLQGKLDDLRTKWEGAYNNYIAERYYAAVDLFDLIECIFDAIPDLETTG